ncbi:RING finger and WD repeat domain-containing protein 2, partial [Coemansia sp. RSA 1722]
MEDTDQLHSAPPPAGAEPLQNVVTGDSSYPAGLAERTTAETTASTGPALNTTAFASETSNLPVRNSTGRVHTVSARASPYSITHHHSNGRHMMTGEAANIPRAAQYHAVGMPARHPLGIQTESMQSDVSSTESADSNGAENEPLMAVSDHDSAAQDTVAGSIGTAESHRAMSSLESVDDESESSDDEEDVSSSNNSNGSTNRNSDSQGRHEDEDALGTNGRGSGSGSRSRSDMTDYEGRPSVSRSHPTSTADEPKARNQKAAGATSASAGTFAFGCPICLDTIREAFMTACGHSFCFRCISRHLVGRQTCPTCLQPLESDQIYPNFALNKLIAQGAAGTTKIQLGHHALQQQQQQPIQSLLQQQSQRQLNIVDQIRSAVENGDELDADDIDTLLTLLQQKRQSMRSYERQFEMATMRQFLLAAQAKKASEMEVLRKELLIVEEDLDYVSTQLDGFAQSSESFRDSALSRLCTLAPCSKRSTAAAASDSMQVPNASTEGGSPADMPQNKRVDEHFGDLESFYFDTRMRGVGEEGLDEFLETLTTFARYERFKPVATLRYGDSTASTAIVASIEFDRDDEVFAVAGVTRKIKIYDYCNVVEQAET